MATIHHTCEDCNSEFTIKYDPDICDSDPLHCPFCSAYILEPEEYDDEDEQCGIIMVLNLQKT